MSSAEGYDLIVPPIRWEEEQGKPAEPPIIHQDPDNDFDDNFEAVVSGTQLFIKSKHNKPITIITGNAKVLLETSKSGILTDVGKLPSTLPVAGDGLVMGIGRTGGDLSYYQYSSESTRWQETSKPGSVTGIKDMPVEIYWDGDSWVLEDEPFAGLLAGDEDSNPTPEFIDWGITGMASYQGRLVILSGSWVYLSATNEPRQFFRSTVEELLDSDPIGIGSSSASSASFKYGVVFNKDLLLFSPEHQALIPGMNQALTPKNAHILVTSTYTADMTTAPVTLGSSVMYPMPRSSTNFGLLEMIPSTYTDSMYSSVDSSEHIPTYLKGRCRFAVSSTVSSMVIFGSSVDLNTLYVHEYMWAGEDKVLKSWHRWEFEAPIAHAFFTGELINIITVETSSGTIFVNTLDPKSNAGTIKDSDSYFLDYSIELPVRGTEGKPTVTLPEMYSNFMLGHDLGSKLTVA
ncbi:MAG: hypothetical protein ACRC9P_06365, partial [Bacteroides sp.]